YRLGHPAVMEQLAPNTGYLLTKCAQSPAIQQRPIRIAMTHLLNAGIRRGSAEDQFLSLCRGFETLARYYGLATQDLASVLDSNNAMAAQSVLKKAADDLRVLASSAQDPICRDALGRMADRVKTANQRDKNFGDAVAALGDHFQFSDPGVMRTSYAS